MKFLMGISTNNGKGTIGAGNVSVRAQFSTNSYTITYNANGGSGAPGVTTYTYAGSGTTTLSAISFVISGIRKGWYEQYMTGLETVMETILEEQDK